MSTHGLHLVQDGEESQNETQQKITALARDVAMMLPKLRTQLTEIDNTIIDVRVHPLPHDANDNTGVHSRVDIILRRKGRKPAYVVSGVFGDHAQPTLSSARLYYEGLSEMQNFSTIFDAQTGSSDIEVYGISMETIKKRLGLLLWKNGMAT